jgi:hypothetical protein
MAILITYITFLWAHSTTKIPVPIHNIHQLCYVAEETTSLRAYSGITGGPTPAPRRVKYLLFDLV